MTDPAEIDLAGLLRAPAESLLRRLPVDPSTDRTRAGDRWLVFEADGLSLRVRCEEDEAGGGSRVASWTATFESPPSSLRAAAGRLGLWPEVAPDAAPGTGESMIRRPLGADGDGPVHSLTAAVRDGRIVQVTAFDEPPDWTDP